jgi:hypothetical protein
MTVLGEAMNKLRQEYANEGKTSTFETLKVFLDPINSITQQSYEAAAHQLQFGLGGVKSLIDRLRKQYTALLREEVGRTVCDPAEIDGEIHALCEALVASEGWLGSMKIEDRRACPVCGTEFSANTEFCPVCALRRGLGEAPESDESSLEKASVDSSPALLAHRFEHWQTIGAIHRGWARSVSGDTAEGIAWIEQGIEDYRATGWVLGLPYHLAQKAEVLYLEDHSSDALEAIKEAEKVIEDLKSASGVSNCIGSEVFFSRLWVLRRPKLRLHFAKRSESQRSRSRFRWRNALKLPTQNIAAKKWVH